MREDFAQIAGAAASLASVGSDVAIMGIQIDNKVKQDKMIGEQLAAAEAAQNQEEADLVAIPTMAAFLGVPVSLSALSSCVLVLLIMVSA